MGLKALKPAPGEGRGVARGVLLSLILHPIAFVAVILIGVSIQRQGGELLALPFIAFIGVTQWIYLGPLVWLLRRRGKTAVMKGVIISGGLLTLGMGLCYGGIGLYSLQQREEYRRVEEYERAHPHDYISANGVVTSVDDDHFEFKRDDTGETVKLRTWDGLDYIFLKKDGGFEKRTRAMLKPGARISVEYSQERGKPPDSASIVRVYEDGAIR